MSKSKISFTNHRQRLFSFLEKKDQGALVCFSGKTQYRNADSSFLFRPNSFFYYLTGCEEENACVVFVHSAKQSQKAVLFVKPKDPKKELWDGPILGIDAAKNVLGFEDVRPIEDLWKDLPELLEGVPSVYYGWGEDVERDRRMHDVQLQEKARRRRHSHSSLFAIYDPTILASALRVKKSAAELDVMRQAASITKKAFDQIFERVQPGMNEKEVHGILWETFLKEGGSGEAYTSIVAGGSNACVLHYTVNNQALKDGDLLLIDAGSEYGFYASDVTRTFPVGKKVSSVQTEIYSAVLEVQEAMIAAVKPGISLVELHEKSCEHMAQKLIDLGFLHEKVETIIEKKLYQEFYPHYLGHYIGLDVHDVGDYKYADGSNVKLEEGMVFTIEPGLYVQTGTAVNVPAAAKGVGVRIEDDILVTKDGCDVLTKEIPKGMDFFKSRSS